MSQFSGKTNNNKTRSFIINSKVELNNNETPKNQNNKEIPDNHDNQKKEANKRNVKLKENIVENDTKKNNIHRINHGIEYNLINSAKVKYVFCNSKLDSLINSIDNYAKKIDKVIANGERTNLMLTKLLDILIEEKSKVKEQAQENLNKDENRDK